MDRFVRRTVIRTRAKLVGIPPTLYATCSAHLHQLVIIESFILIGNYQIENSLDFLLKTGLDAEGNPIQQSGWKSRVAHGVSELVASVQRLRRFLVQRNGQVFTGIFGFLFFLSLLPVAWLQTTLHLELLLSDVMATRNRAQELTTDTTE